MNPQNILITGAQLGNKGAESMLYITVDELSKRFPGCNIFFGTTETYDERIYRFHRLDLSERLVQVALGGWKSYFAIVECFCMNLIKIVTGNKKKIQHYSEVKKAMSEMDLVVDVSGFNIGKQWSKEAHDLYLTKIELAKKYNVPVYLLPQSFGPFDYEIGMEKIVERIKCVLPYCNIIFAREKEGYNELVDTFHFSNIALSTDLVLQNKSIDINNVFTNAPSIDIPSIHGKNIIGVAPNKQCFRFGDHEKILHYYKTIIDDLLCNDHTVVLFRHSREDFECCKEIKNLYADNEKIIIESKELSCLEYNEYVKQFSYIICSRFHGIVHAYKNHIPCIALGWAVKYKELTKCVGQEEYYIDITSEIDSTSEILLVLRRMESNYQQNKIIIQEHVDAIQSYNCFDVMEEDYIKRQ